MSLSCVIPLGFGLVVFRTGQSQATVNDNEFSLLDESDTIVGEMFRKTVSKSYVDCSTRCVFDTMCFAYQYIEQNNLNCRLIHRSSLVGQKFVSNETKIYLKVCRESWTPLNSWTAGDQLTVYRSFDEENYCFELINGVSIASGKLFNAVKTNHIFKKWVSLGDLSRYTCLPKPSTCGPEGASLSVWIKINDCSARSGFISSLARTSSGFVFQCKPGGFGLRHEVRVSDGYFHYTHGSIATHWFHLVMIFHGPSDGQGMSIYHDGSLFRHDSSKMSRNFTESSGNMIIGKRFTDRDEDYGSVMVDELMFWDRELLPEEIQALAAA